MTAATAFVPLDDHDRRRARRARGLLAEINDAGFLEAADVHVAQRLARLGGETSPEVLLAVAVAVRAVRAGSVCVDLRSVGDLAPGVRWPDPDSWVSSMRGSALVADGVLCLEGTDLYLRRYWEEERQVVEDLRRRDESEPVALDPGMVAAALAAYFPDDDSTDQRLAAELSCRRWTSVITGGPGTGKTTTIARLLGVLLTVAGDQPLRVALAAPTGKAAARMGQALREATDVPGFPGRDGAADGAGDGAGDGAADGAAARRRDQIRGYQASTIHRLLGWRPDSSTRFRHDRSNPLPYDVVVVDETSMVSLTLMARLLESMRPQARLVLVGDADQLASVEAGAVLGDVVRGWSSTGPVRRLDRTRRFGMNIAELAQAIRAGDDD